MIRVVLPLQLRRLAVVSGEVLLDAPVRPTTLGLVLDALEADYPMLQGTVLDYATRQRRPMLRFYASGEDLSQGPLDTPLPEAVATGADPFWSWGSWPVARTADALV